MFGFDTHADYRPRSQPPPPVEVAVASSSSASSDDDDDVIHDDGAQPSNVIAGSPQPGPSGLRRVATPEPAASAVASSDDDDDDDDDDYDGGDGQSYGTRRRRRLATPLVSLAVRPPPQPVGLPSGSERVWMGFVVNFLGFYPVLLRLRGPFRFSGGFMRFRGVVPCCHGLCWGSIGFLTGLIWVFRVHIDFFRGFSGFYLVLPSFTSTQRSI